MRTVRRLLVVIAVAASLCAVVWVPALAGPLRPPTGLSGRADSDTQVSLSWNAAGGATAQSSYTDTTVAPATGYAYWIRGVWTGSTSDSSPLTVFTGRRTTTTLSASPTPSEDQQWVMLSATVRPADATVSSYGGEVVFYSGSTWLGVASVDYRGVADRMTLVPSGDLRAEYRGDTSVPLVSSTSDPVPHTVVPAANPPVSFGPYRAYHYGLDSWPVAAAVADVTGDGR